jgi:hypothetical protein
LDCEIGTYFSCYKGISTWFVCNYRNWMKSYKRSVITFLFPIHLVIHWQKIFFI